MAREITLAGLRMTFEEWQGLDDESRALLLRAFIETTARRYDDQYESYELSLE